MKISFFKQNVKTLSRFLPAFCQNDLSDLTQIDSIALKLPQMYILTENIFCSAPSKTCITLIRISGGNCDGDAEIFKHPMQIKYKCNGLTTTEMSWHVSTWSQLDD